VCVGQFVLVCHAYSVFKVQSNFPDKEKRAWRLPDPLLVDLSTPRHEPQGANPKGVAVALVMA
jgi:hypothetical protein